MDKALHLQSEEIDLCKQKTFQVQVANWRDLFPLRQLEYDCFKKDAWPLLELLAVLTLPGTVRLKAVADDRMVGFIASDQHRMEDVGWIITLGVLRDYRRRGIAAALLDECERQIALPCIHLTVRRSNQAAILLYEKLGYRQVDVWSRYYYGGEDALLFEKNLVLEAEEASNVST